MNTPDEYDDYFREPRPPVQPIPTRRLKNASVSPVVLEGRHVAPGDVATVSGSTLAHPTIRLWLTSGMLLDLDAEPAP
jgi:hypothetical protein